VPEHFGVIIVSLKAVLRHPWPRSSPDCPCCEMTYKISYALSGNLHQQVEHTPATL